MCFSGYIIYQIFLYLLYCLNRRERTTISHPFFSISSRAFSNYSSPDCFRSLKLHSFNITINTVGSGYRQSLQECFYSIPHNQSIMTTEGFLYSLFFSVTSECFYQVSILFKDKNFWILGYGSGMTNERVPRLIFFFLSLP